MIISRSEAINNNLKFYFTDKPCLRGHVANRWVSNCSCVICDYQKQKKDKSKSNKKRWYELNKEITLKRASENYYANREKKIKYANDYQKKNLKKIIEQRKQREYKDPLYALKIKISKLIAISIKNNGYTKNSKTFEILGCSFDEFKKHIEKQFLKGMDWNNRCLWHLDHIIPVSSAKNEQDLISLNHFTNFRPLWAKDNLEKSNKMEFLL
jgi:hypothetical protein